MSDNTRDLVPVGHVTLRDPIDSWIPVLADVGTLAKAIADTDFVPQAFRGKPAAVAAAVLTGRELGIGPMTALANLYVVHGHVGMSAQLMRQLILAAGHDLRFVDATDTRCIVEGRRRGSEEWSRAEFTADQARRARIDLGAYPADKLVARATSRLARRLFADCLGGVPYLAEELEDGAGAAAPTGVEAPTAPAGRTVQRRPRPAPLQPPAPPLEQAQDDDAAPSSDLLDEDKARQVLGGIGRTMLFKLTSEGHLQTVKVGRRTFWMAADIQRYIGRLKSEQWQDGPETAPQPPEQPTLDEPPLDDPQPPQPPPQATRGQLTAIAAAMGELGYRDRPDRLRLTSRLTGRDIPTGKDLTREEAGALLDTLTMVQASPDPQARIIEISEAAALRAGSADD